MSNLQATNPLSLAPGQMTHRVLITGTNRPGETTFTLPAPVLNVETCRVVYAQIPATATTTSAVRLKLGDREVEKVQTAIPTAMANKKHYFGGKAHFFVVPNGVEIYQPQSPMDDSAAFTPHLVSVPTVTVEIYAIPSPTRELLDLKGDTFAILLELASRRR